ncbi:MAG: surface-adhesin E family protein [Vulcanimicrobiota bacterium]
MSRLIATIAFTAFFLLIGPANAEWVHIATSNEGDAYYYDTKDIERYSDYNRVWIRCDYAQPTESGYTRYVSQEDFHKTQRMSRRLAIAYFKNDEKMASQTYPEPDWEAIGWSARVSVLFSVWKKCSRLEV